MSLARRFDNARAHGAQRGFQRGFTMIEVLITFVILAIGLLGIVSLMTTSKTSQHEAVQRARAVNMADGLVERVRENPDGVLSYVTGLNSPLGGGTTTTEPTNCETNPCAPNAIAAHDLWAWEQELNGSRATVVDGGNVINTAGLKEPRGCVLFNAFGGRQRTGTLTVIVQWRGLHETSDGVAGGNECGNVAYNKAFRRQVRVSSFVLDTGEL